MDWLVLRIGSFYIVWCGLSCFISPELDVFRKEAISTVHNTPILSWILRAGPKYSQSDERSDTKDGLSLGSFGVISEIISLINRVPFGVRTRFSSSLLT